MKEKGALEKSIQNIARVAFFTTLFTGGVVIGSYLENQYSQKPQTESLSGKVIAPLLNPDSYSPKPIVLQIANDQATFYDDIQSSMDSNPCKKDDRFIAIIRDNNGENTTTTLITSTTSNCALDTK